MKFAFHLPVNLLFGNGVIEEIGSRAAAYGKKAVIVTGRGSTKKSGLLDRVVTLLEKAGVESAVYDKVEPNPTTDTVSACTALIKTEKAGLVIGLGGGSMMDAAKASAFMAKNSGDLMDYVYARKVSPEALPVILVPTTCGTGSEGNGFAVVTDSRTGDKKSLRGNMIIAKLSIIDPELMKTMPRSVLASVGFDALCHTMEAYLSAASTPLTDIMALEGMRLIHENLVRLYEGQGGGEAWENVTWASTLGGMVIGVAGVTAPHGIEHPPSGIRNITHGRGLAALTPVITDRSIAGVDAAAREKYAVISRCLGGRDEKDCTASIKRLLRRLELVTTLGEQGVKEGDIDRLAENALKVSAAGIANHPVVFALEEIKQIYRDAL
jgi:alcohol dehydrogenase class IV